MACSYQGTRFEQPMVHSLVLHGNASSDSHNSGAPPAAVSHDFYGPWFNSTAACSKLPVPNCCSCDFDFNGSDDIIAGPLSAATGPVDCFAAAGWDAAEPGSGSFVKIGVGALQRPAESEDSSHSDMFLYNITDRGKWTTNKGSDFVEFVQTLDDSTGSGYAFAYTKRISLQGATMTIARRLKNTGKLPIESETFTHNFLTLDQQPPAKGTTVSVPWAIPATDPTHPPLNATLAKIDPSGKSVVFQTTLGDEESFYVDLAASPKPASENRIEINSTVAVRVKDHLSL
jgi:hypothetical protein